MNQVIKGVKTNPQGDILETEIAVYAEEDVTLDMATGEPLLIDGEQVIRVQTDTKDTYAPTHPTLPPVTIMKSETAYYPKSLMDTILKREKFATVFDRAVFNSVLKQHTNNHRELDLNYTES